MNISLRSLLADHLRRPGESTALFNADGPSEIRPNGFFVTEVPEDLPQDRDVWFSLNPGTDDGRGRVAIATVTRVAALHADLDFGGGGKSMPSVEAAMAVVGDLSEMLGTRPAVLIGSGHGVQPLWTIDLEETKTGPEAVEILKQWGALVAHVAKQHGGRVDSVFEPARLVRAPGSTNWKRMDAPVPAFCQLDTGRPLSWSEVDEAITAYPVPAQERPEGAPGPKFELPAVIAAGERYPVLMSFASSMRAQGVPRAAADLAFETAIARCESPETFKKDPRTILADVYARYDAPPPKVDDSGLFRNAPKPQAIATASGIITQGMALDVTDRAVAVEWLREHLGTGPLSGVFHRKGSIVHTPRIGEDGYIAPREGRVESAASIATLTTESLTARVQVSLPVVQRVIDKPATKVAKSRDPDAEDVFKFVPAMCPIDVGRTVANAADSCIGLRDLRGVVHNPVLRPDGTILDAPGYDDATGLLFLPTNGQPPAIPDYPTRADVEMARGWLDYMLNGFAFVTDSDRANYLGLALTPLLRAIAPAPYKMGVIEAHQAGSGKSFLARALCSIHGGVMQSEMPAEDEEMRKVIGSVLDSQTAPVVVFDNVSGLVRSSTLAGLLTSPTFQTRRLGGNSIIEADNDRLWIITANNAQLGGDLGRRNVRVRIDPGVPNPELRTGFAISNFEAWVRENRGMLLWSLLTLVRAWVVNGAPMTLDPKQDSYGQWTAIIQGILTNAGIPGIFDDPAMHESMKDPETEEWQGLLEVIHARLGTNPWTAKSLLALVSHPLASVPDPLKPLPFDALPAGLYAGRSSVEPATLAKSLGRWMMNRKGKWFGALTIEEAGMDAHARVKVWRIKVAEAKTLAPGPKL